MSKISVAGLEVAFPLIEIYPQQKAIMSKVITALNRNENALIESPTGTGKTLALLCSALEWQKRNSDTKIYYASRTHKQLTQVINELKKTEYANVKMTILASRAQSCINLNVRHQSDCKEACKKQITETGCEFYTNLLQSNYRQLRRVISEHLQVKRPINAKPTRRPDVDGATFDIEDIATIGTNQSFCPYFATTKFLTEDATLIFCPYNYLIDLNIRRSMNIKFDKKTVIIIDEAHNLEQQCREAVNFCIPENELSDDINSFVAACSIADNENLLIEAYRAFYQLCTFVLEFLKTGHHPNIWNGSSQYVSSDLHVIIDSNGEQIRNRLISFGITEENKPKYMRYLQNIENSFEHLNAKNVGRSVRQRSSSVANASNVKLRSVEKLLTFTKYFFSRKGLFQDDFKLGFTRKNNLLALNAWCMNSAVAFNFISNKTLSVILASGTLSPFDTFESELDAPFKQRLQNDHVLSRERMFIRSIGRGPSGVRLNFSYDYRSKNKDELLDELGCLVLPLCAATPGGVLCFFPSYSFLQEVEQRWKETDAFSEISERKPIFCEPKNNSDVADKLEKFRRLVDVGKGALMLGVYRGKISEGMDFENAYARLVICIGIPYLMLKDPDIKMKRDYNKSKIERSSRLTDDNRRRVDSWYEIQAFRAVNQALGRCLRHRHDWASLILVDERYANAESVQYLSKWVRENIVHHATDANEMIENVRRFSSALAKDDDWEAELSSTFDKECRLVNNGKENPLATSTPVRHSLNNTLDDEVNNARLENLHNVATKIRCTVSTQTLTDDEESVSDEETDENSSNSDSRFHKNWTPSANSRRVIGKYAIFNNSLD